MIRSYQRFIFLPFVVLLLVSCSSASKKSDHPELRDVYGKKVALVETKAEAALEKRIQSQLLSQLVSRGTFVLLSRYAVNEAIQELGLNPDFKKAAIKVGAVYMLRIDLLQLKSDYVKMKLEFTRLDDFHVFSETAEASGSIKDGESITDSQDRLIRQALAHFFDQYIFGN